jgi:type IV pilus assembly protein PilE
MKRRTSGFTLTELLITVAIVAIIAAVAIPSYREYVRRANRTEATTALLRIAGNQERFYLQNNVYASNDQLDDAPPAGLGIEATTERGLYALEIDSDDLTLGYTATATPVAGEPQDDDDDCASFTIDAQGLRTATDADGADNTETCWR